MDWVSLVAGKGMEPPSQLSNNLIIMDTYRHSRFNAPSLMILCHFLAEGRWISLCVSKSWPSRPGQRLNDIVVQLVLYRSMAQIHNIL